MLKASKKARTNMKIAVATATCVFTLATTFTATIAWFASNQAASVTGMSIRVSLDMSNINGVTVHRCRLSESTSAHLKFESEPSVRISGSGSVQEISGIQMDDYSILNQTQPVLLLFTFKDGIEASSINMTASADSNTFVSAATAQNVSSFPFSSAVRFKCASYTSATFPFDNVSTSDLSNTSSFVTVTLDNQGQVTNTTFTQQLNLFTGSGNTEVTYLAVVLDYYPDAIDYIVNNTSYDIFQGNNNCINFICDWSLAL